ncbi:MAG TPA: AMP-binding protein [Rudaea sp.]|jgi:acyl-coenzyme A synthetase/AMP-(fatty) acid ligase
MRRLSLLASDDLQRALIRRAGMPVSAGRFIAQAEALALRLPPGRYAVNLCDDRYQFLLAFCAIALAGQTSLLPAARTPHAIAGVMQAYPGSYALGDAPIEGVALGFSMPGAAELGDADAQGIPSIAADHLVAIGFTSGSTGVPKPNAKTWASICASSALNAALLGVDACGASIVATVPPQHMYGLEMSVLLPLRSHAAVHAGQPFFPGDVAHALHESPAPRVLVTTPFHLRTLLHDAVALPALQAIVTATAPLDTELACLAEARFDAPVIEVFGSTETCVIAHRRTVRDEPWRLYRGIELHPQPDGTLVHAPHFEAPTLLQDIVELLPEHRFRLCGRNSDLLEIAGKRASLADLTRHLLALDGVHDGVIFQLDADARGLRRLAALVVAPTLDEARILAALRAAIDPVFLPRPLRRVDALPRNAAGKLPREALLAALNT